MTWFLIPNSPDPNCGTRKVEKGRRRAVLSQVSYCAPQLKPPHLTAPLMSSKCCSVFLPQQTWNFMECQDSEPAGSCRAEMPPSCGYDQAMTKRSASSNISRPANLRARETHRENPQRNPSSALPSLGSRFFQQKVFPYSFVFCPSVALCSQTAMSGSYHELMSGSSTKAFSHREIVQFCWRYRTTH